VPFAEADGGLDGDLSDLVVIAEELGRAAASTPLLDSVALGGLPLSWAPASAARERWLPGLVSGDRIAAAALLEPDGRSRWPAPSRPGRRRLALQGRKTMVGFAATSDVLLSVPG